MFGKYNIFKTPGWTYLLSKSVVVDSLFIVAPIVWLLYFNSVHVLVWLSVFSVFSVQYNLFKTTTLKKTENWFSIPSIA